jgi:F-box domain
MSFFQFLASPKLRTDLDEVRRISPTAEVDPDCAGEGRPDEGAHNLDLNRDCWALILQHLTPVDLCRLAKTCRSWRRIGDDVRTSRLPYPMGMFIHAHLLRLYKVFVLHYSFIGKMVWTGSFRRLLRMPFTVKRMKIFVSPGTLCLRVLYR